MEVENDHIFPYVESLLEGNADQNFAIESYARGHTHIAPKLKELKDIIVRYYPEKDIDLLNSALFDIITCEQDLHSHCQVEDMIFIPAVAELEAKVRMEMNDSEDTSATDPVDGPGSGGENRDQLQIHSPAGLTIFAIVNGLLPIAEIPRL